MKKIFVLVATATLVLSGCGASKKAQMAYMYQQQQTVPQNQQPSRKLRTQEQCIALANEDSEYLRAYGTATSYVEKTAINEAERDARNRLAAMMKTAVEGAAQDYEQNASSNLQKSAETIGEQIMTQYVVGEVSNTKTLRTDIYDLSDGSIQVYVCIEMRKSTEEVIKGIDNTLDQNGIIQAKYDREKFYKSIKGGLEEYKKRQMAE